MCVRGRRKGADYLGDAAGSNSHDKGCGVEHWSVKMTVPKL